jgi:two-component system sensor histidine kinase KdpD
MREVCDLLARESGMDRVWVGIGPTITAERVAADSGTGPPPISGGAHSILQRDQREGEATWRRIHPPSARPEAQRAGPIFRVELRADQGPIGSLWALRTRPEPPQLEQTRLLAAAADQLGAAIWRDSLRTQAAELEIARRSDELKSALVDSVSHDLRTPLGTIRAAAGSLADPGMDLPAAERRAAAVAIDVEAGRLNRLVGDLLDMSRIQGGALVPEIEIYPLSELVTPIVERASASGDGRPISVDLPPDLPAVRVDAVLLDRIVTNLLDNAVKHAGEGAAIRVRASASGDEAVALTVEDGGSGVPAEAMDHIFEQFTNVGGTDGRARHGVGLGLAIVRGLADVMGASVVASRSQLGGLAVTVTLAAQPEDAG